jgi:FAD/FMN-containing dehydrogenase
MVPVTKRDLELLARTVDGDLIVPGDPRYDAARRVWNGEIDRCPRLIARCTSATDVRAVLALASQRGLPVSIRGGGHSVAGHGVCDGGLSVDLSLMRGVQVDRRTGLVAVQGGATWADVDRATQPHGSAVPGGIVSHTGVGGLTLGGGLGYLVRRYGLTIDSLIDADVVTAEGNHITADRSTEPELFWGLRGGGGNFGVVTRFGFRLRPVGPSVLAGMVVYPFADAPAVLAGYKDVVEQAPDELGTVVNLRLCPSAPGLPAGWHGRPVIAIVACWSGNARVGRAQLRPLRELASPVADTIAQISYQQLQQLADVSVPHGDHYYWRSVDLGPLTRDVIEAIVAGAAGITSPKSAVPLYDLGGAASRVPAGDSAYGPRDARHNLSMFAGWTPADPDRDRHVGWVRSFSQAMTPYARGRYVNFLSDEGADAVRATYGERWQRLVALKRRFDPDNLFRYNHNVSPAG